MKPITRLAAILLLVSAVFIPTSLVVAQDANAAAELRAEVKAMRAEYETRIKKLEERIAQLEKKTPTPVASPARVTAAEREVIEKALEDKDKAKVLEEEMYQARLSFLGNTEIQDISRHFEASKLREERLEAVLESFVDISGYFRAGYGRSDAGGPQRGFGIPGIGGTKYRLGNEAENYGEVAFSKTFFAPGIFDSESGATVLNRSKEGPVAQTNVRLSIFNPYSDAGGTTDFGMPELWASVGNVFPTHPETKFWAGKRFYRRHDIHMNDFFFYNMSGSGGGVEDFQFGPGKLALAWIGDAAESTIFGREVPADPENEAGFSKTNIDLRYYDFPFLGGTGEVGLVYSNAKSGIDAEGKKAPDTQGGSLQIVRTKTGFTNEESIHKTSLQVGTGPAKTFTSGFDSFTIDDGTFIRPDPNSSWRVRVTDQLVTRPWEALSLGTVAVYQYTDFGSEVSGQHWASLGARPILHINHYFNIAFEGGVDWVSDSPFSSDGYLGKLTLAPQISFGDTFFSRPVIRGFVTYGFWSNDFDGSVGGPDYTGSTSGWSYGVQMESWW